MVQPKSADVLCVGFAATQDHVVDDLIGVRFPVAQSLVGAYLLVVSEEKR